VRYRLDKLILSVLPAFTRGKFVTQVQQLSHDYRTLLRLHMQPVV
jgi:hypothetical protein